MTDQQSESSRDLTTDDGLRKMCEAIGPASQWAPDQAEWVAKVAGTIEWVRGADEETRATPEFQQRLWEDNHIALPGQGRISVQGVIADPEFRRWVAKESLEISADGSEEGRLEEFYGQLVVEIKARLAESKVPHLKILRVIAALFPERMTTIADRGAVQAVARELDLVSPTTASPIVCHAYIRQRLDAAIGPCESANALALAERMILPWMIRTRMAGLLEGADRRLVDRAKSHPKDDDDGKPLPAALRRRGLTAIGGMFQTVLSTLEFLRSGATRQELMAFLRTGSPDLKNDSLAVIINALVAELGVIVRDGNRYSLTKSGRDVLDTQDPIHLADWMLRRVLGVDLAVATVRDQQAIARASLIAVIRAANPGWTTDYAPQAIVSWLRNLKVMAVNDESDFVLTDAGRQWAERISWEPEVLDDVERDNSGGADSAGGGDIPMDGPIDVRLPSQTELVAAVLTSGQFAPQQVAHLHATLWGHSRRHFAILTGLSGSGKTLLARSYAQALTSAGTRGRTCVVPVQPGWYDASALLGFQNPLRGGSYVRTTFLDFLIAAANNPADPHVVILDEMNLSHPEQYMAPLLSAMETGDVIPLHSDPTLASIVPTAIPYPRNLAIIGTMNTDETTHGLSDKVLDRAFVHEFWEIDLDAYPRWATRAGLDTAQKTKVRQLLGGLMDALSPARRHFGWRVVDDMLDYLCLAIAGPHGLEFTAALDSVVYAKVLPKLRGDDSAKFRGSLAACDAVLAEFALTRSRRKLEDLQRELDATGSAQFWR